MITHERDLQFSASSCWIKVRFLSCVLFRRSEYSWKRLVVVGNRVVRGYFDICFAHRVRFCFLKLC